MIIKTLDSVHNYLFSGFKFQIWAISDRNDGEFANSWDKHRFCDSSLVDDDDDDELMLNVLRCHLTY